LVVDDFTDILYLGKKMSKFSFLEEVIQI